MRRSILTTTAAAVLAGGLLAGATGTAHAKTTGSWSLSTHRIATSDPSVCRFEFTITPQPGDRVDHFVYQTSSSPITPVTKGRKESLPEGISTTSSVIDVDVPIQPGTLYFDAQIVYSGGQSSAIAWISVDTSYC